MADSSTRNRKTTGCLTTIAEARRLAAARRERTFGLESNPIEISSDSDNSSDDDSDCDVVLVGSNPKGRPLIPLDIPVGAPKDHDRNSKPDHMKTTTEKPTSKSVNALPETSKCSERPAQRLE